MIDQRIFEERNFHGVKGVVFLHDKMLVYQRDTKTFNFPLCIDLPGGGKENHESPFETFKREVFEEFGITVNQSDIVYAKKYKSAFDQTKESYFIVTKPLNIKESDIIFGDEGLRFFTITPEEFLVLSNGIERQKKKVREYLEFVKSMGESAAT